MFIDEAKPHRRRAFVPNPCTTLISLKVFFKSVCKHPHKSVDVSFTITDVKSKLTDLCRN